MVNKKILLGQFYTIMDPFNSSDAFKQWWKMCPRNSKLLEPFAGAGHLFNFIKGNWNGFDLDPTSNKIIKRDTLKDFPTGYDICITNPPYLAKTVISKKKYKINLKHQDLYLDCIEECLKNCGYVAAIIPSTFWGTNKFRNRLYAWDKIDCKIFNDTDNPVGVGYWIPREVGSTKIFVNGKKINLDEYTPSEVNIPIKFNSPNGNVILCCIDNTKKENIQLSLNIKTFDRKKFLKHSSRNYSLVECALITRKNIEKINDFISKWRKNTNDFFLTSFKSTMKNGKYRKRLSFSQFKWVVRQAVEINL